MRVVDDRGRELPRDGQTVGNLQVGGVKSPILHLTVACSAGAYFWCLLRILYYDDQS